MTTALDDVLRIYNGSNGDDTRWLYERLEKIGPAGIVATNLFRACKASERAKKYRGGTRMGSFRSMAYERKNWALNNLAHVLTKHAASLAITWGWGVDPGQEYHRHVLFIETPAGQVSFHTHLRGLGPQYDKPWDGVRGVAVDRIGRWCASLLTGEPLQAPTVDPVPPEPVQEQLL